jgi:DUF4097 and DUF4098 domain-containing protein YvlB
MPTFDTPEPIFAAIEFAAGKVRIFASDRTDTVVDVRPSNRSNSADVQTAEQTRIEYARGKLLVTAPKDRPRSLLGSLLGWGPSIDVTIELPAGSRIDADAAAEFRCEGRLGDCRFKSTSGDVRLDEIGKLQLRCVGDVSVNRAVGHADVSTGNGDVWIRELDGTATIKSANGDIAVGEATGDLRLATANGDITVDRALASVSAKTAYGGVRIGEVGRGAVVLWSAAGDLEVGIADGTAAWLDLNTMHGSVRNSLDAFDGPGPSDDTVEVRARTADGDIVIHRSQFAWGA